MSLDRRHFLRGLIAAPAVVAAAHLMPIRGIVMDVAPFDWAPQDFDTEFLLVKGYERYSIAFTRAFALTKEHLDANLLNSTFPRLAA